MALITDDKCGKVRRVIFMSRCQKCQNLKNRIKSERINIFKIEHMRKVAQILRNMRKIFQKIWYFFTTLCFYSAWTKSGLIFPKIMAWECNLTSSMLFRWLQILFKAFTMLNFIPMPLFLEKLTQIFSMHCKSKGW